MAQGIAHHRKRQVPAEDTPAFGAIAERFRRAGDLDRAVALCQEGLAKFPDHLSARVTLGWSLLDLGRYEEAREALEGALKRAPDNLAAIRGLAELHDRAEHTMHVPMDGPGEWPPDPSTIDNLHLDPAADTSPASAPADLPLKGEALSLDALLSRVAQRGKAKGKGKKGKDGAEQPQAGAFEPLDVLINPPSPESGAVPELIQSKAHRDHQTSAPTDLNALIDEIDQIVPAVPAGPAGDDADVDLGLSTGDVDIEKALQQAQAAAEQAAADAVATRKAAEEQAATDSKARKAAEEKAAAEAAARKAAEDRAASEAAARKAAEEKAAAEVKARKAAEEKAAAEKAAAEAAAKKAAEKAAQEAAARKAADEKAAAEAAAKKVAEEKAAVEAAAKKAAEEKAAAEAAAKAAAEKAAAEAKARKAAEQKAAAEAAARKAAEEKAAAETAARQAAEKAAADAAKRAAEDRAAAEAAATRAAEERASAAEAAARKAAEEMAEAEAAAKQAAKAAAAEAEARVAAAEQRTAVEVVARVAAEQAVLDARPALKLTNPTVRDFPDPQLEIRAADIAFDAGESAGPWDIPLLDAMATEESGDVELEQLAAELSATLEIGPAHPALPALESLLRRVETRRSQLMAESVA